MYLLILNPSAKDYEKFLERIFPKLSIHAVTREEEIGDFIEKTDILFTGMWSRFSLFLRKISVGSSEEK